MINKIAKILVKKKLTISAAESCTGGMISSAITDIPGSSKYFKMGVVAYSNEAKISILGVKKQTIKDHGAVSQETALELAENVRRIASSSIGIGITGIAGPSGGTSTKPNGTVFIAISLPHHSYFKKFIFHGNRLKVRKLARNACFKLLLKCLS